MKRFQLLPSILLVIAGSLASTAVAEMPTAGQAKHRTTHEALMQRRSAALKKAGVEKGRGLKEVEPGSIKYEERKKMPSLLERSSILCFGGYWTLVPKEALLHVPATCRSRVDGPGKGKLIPWAQFYAKNRGWLQTHSVHISQARGEKQLEPKKVDVYKKSGRVVVAVCHNGPISVKPLKVADAVADAVGAQ